MNYSHISTYIRERCRSGSAYDVDAVLQLLNNETDLPTTKLIDFYLGCVSNDEGISRMEYYLFNGTQIQRNYCTLFFARRNDWILVNRAYKAGLIDYKQAYSR